MRERSILPSFGEKMNDYKKSSQVIDILDSIPENDNRVSDRLPLFCGNKGVNECKRERSGQRTEKRYNSSSNGVNLPKLQKKSTAVPPLERTISSPNPTGFLNVANIALSPRKNTGDKFKREPVVNCADYLIYEPACTTANLATANIDLSRYAFHSSLERIPETDGERLLSVHSKKKLQSAEVKKKEPNTPERKTRKRRETKASGLKNVDLFDQQRQHLARKGPPARVLVSCKFPESRPGTPNYFRKSSAVTEDLFFPKIVLYQWEVCEQPKITKALQSRKYPIRLPLLHKIPTAPQDNQPIDGDYKGHENDAKRPESPLSKIPYPPPPTPQCQTCPPSSKGNIADK